MLRNISFLICLVFGFGVPFMFAQQKNIQEQKTAVPDLAHLRAMTARFAPTRIEVNTSKLSAGDRQVLVKLIEAARILNHVFMQQYWSGDLALYSELQKDKSSLGAARLHYFWINKGPWSALDANKAFLPEVPPEKLPGANFYPENMTKENFEQWVAGLPAKDQEQAKSFFTVIRWKSGNNGELQSLPYSEEYKADLTRAAKLLHEAAVLTGNASLKK